MIRVLTEGLVTEPEYVGLWTRHYRDRVSVNFSEHHGVPLALVQRAVELERRSKRNAGKKGGTLDHDEIWCVFDVDEHPNLREALNLARQHGIGIALSNPCVELWFVLHWEDQFAAVHRDDAQRKCAELKICDGKHLELAAQQRLVERFEEAKARALQLDRWHEGIGSDAGANPSSSVWKLVEALGRLG